MYKKRTLFFALCLSLLASVSLSAQSSETYDVLILHSGSIVKGTIIELVENEYVIIKLEVSGRTKRYKMDGVAQIKQVDNLALDQDVKAETPRKEREKPTYQFKETGRFTAINFGFSFGKRQRNEVIFDPIFFPTPRESTQNAIGFNLQLLMGKQLSRRLGVGGGISYDAYNLEDGESILTVLGHCRGYMTSSIISPYWALSGGYGFALANKTQGVEEAKGGLMLHPELGVRLGASDKTNFTLSMGYRFQKARYIQEFPFNGDIEYRNVRYRRFLFSIGLLF